MIKIHLVDRNHDVIEAWQESFKSFPEVTVHFGDIFENAFDTIVSPANSRGFMDGGIDLVYRNFFGPAIEQSVKRVIRECHGGFLPVGESTMVRTGHDRVVYMIVAPTMEGPMRVDAINAYRAMTATLRMATRYADRINDVFVPGMCTGVGHVPPKDAADAMAEAYANWVRRNRQEE